MYLVNNKAEAIKIINSIDGRGYIIQEYIESSRAEMLGFTW